MAILGATAEPTNSAQAWSNADNHFGLVLTFPGGGPWKIQKSAVWAAGYGASPSAITVVWDNAGNVLGYSNSFTLTARTFGPSGSDLYDRDIVNGSGYLSVPGGTVVVAGYCISPLTSGCFHGKLASGSFRRVDKTSGFPGTLTGYTTEATGAMGAYITYVLANSAPSAPTWVTASGLIVTDLTPQLWFTHVDVDGDAVLNYDLQIDTTSGDQVEPDWASLFQDLVDQTTDDDGAVGGDTSIKKSINTISRGQWYAARARTADAISGQGAWSQTLWFKGNSLPTISSRNPG